ncbi:hypothetical protein [Thalassospira lohafexi]|uniref:Uncharacterized protein n=1 Tax=Thalassospira lohafexi TaxID=744227 RepID=A0A2N3L505_9PROT|nr:hypothetical protein [Thalassospira lohafexi]PKR57770.1 hypothetical protein COO92_13430 [Thalassospira lohafexi]
MKLDDQARNWGEIANDFLIHYKILTNVEQAKLLTSTSKSIRFKFMNQYLSHVVRTLDTLDNEELSLAIERSIHMISLDNFEHDYRETSLRVQVFLERLADYEAVFHKIWSQNQDLVSTEMKKRINWLVSIT